jgi:hypothetical protein
VDEDEEAFKLQLKEAFRIYDKVCIIMTNTIDTPSMVGLQRLHHYRGPEGHPKGAGPRAEQVSWEEVILSFAVKRS